MTIAEFLEARIAEDEAELKSWAKRYAAPGWTTTDYTYGGTDDYQQFTMGYGRALAECAAKRAILAEHSPVDPCDAHDAEYKTIICPTIRVLAAIYADHRDYQQEWAT